MKQRCFCDCTLSEKLLYTAFLLLMGTGYLMALVYLYTSHQGHDGKPGLSRRLARRAWVMRPVS